MNLLQQLVFIIIKISFHIIKNAYTNDRYIVCTNDSVSNSIVISKQDLLQNAFCNDNYFKE